MVLFKRTEDGKKRCLILNSVGMQCTKRRNHVNKELDVVHQAGMFIWRMGGLMELTNSLVFTKPGRQGHRATSVIFDEAHQHKAGDHVTAGQMDPITPPPNPYAGIEPIWNDPITASPEQQLTEWWIQQAEDEVARTVPKAIEYSATDLTDIGFDLARTAGREVTDEEAAELGVFFYLRGKMARWVGAVIAGERVSDDTLFDIGVYVRMAQRIREKGNWPGVENLDG